MTDSKTDLSDPKSTTLFEKIALKEAMKKQEAYHYAMARKHCKSFIDAYVECSKDLTISVAWMCRAQNQEMRKCMTEYEANLNTQSHSE